MEEETQAQNEQKEDIPKVQEEAQEEVKEETRRSSPNEQTKATLASKTKTFLIECKRVLKITKKPTKEEFKTIVKISGLGILLIGLIGFIVNLISMMVK